MDCLTQTRSVVRSRGLPGVARIPEAAAGVEGTAVAVAVAAGVVGGTAVAVADAAIPLVVGRVGVEPVVEPVTPAVDVTIQPVVERVGTVPAVAKG